MFERPHHQRIATLLYSLDAEQLRRSGCLFGGGTAIALAHGEYRESLDINFICASVDGYRAVRNHVNRTGMNWVLSREVPLVREPRVDQYGVRCAFRVDGVPIKFEIVHEGRVQFDAPEPGDRICGIWTLRLDDRVATKLMANADRWADDSVMSRDLIDLALQSDTGVLPRAGVDKAQRAYGDSIVDCFTKAKTTLLTREGRLKACMKSLGMTLGEAEVRARIERLVFEERPPAG